MSILFFENYKSNTRTANEIHEFSCGRVREKKNTVGPGETWKIKRNRVQLCNNIREQRNEKTQIIAKDSDFDERKPLLRL
jgi:hypothetical protein